MDTNPYAPPTSLATIRESSETVPAYLSYSWRQFLLALAGVTLICGMLVASYVWLTQTPGVSIPEFHSFYALPQAAVFSSAAWLLILVFGVPWERRAMEHKVKAVIFFLVASVSFTLAWYLIEYSTWEFAGIVGSISSGQFLTLMFICHIRHLALRWRRLIGLTLLAHLLWWVIIYTFLLTIVQHQPVALQDYYGYSLLTVSWLLSVGVQIPFLTRRPLERPPSTSTIYRDIDPRDERTYDGY